jgi:phospholipid/cholesterol/gamma-HCH transport system substrate-binding protein
VSAIRNAIRKHLRDFVALVLLISVGLFTGGYIISRQRVYVPGWVPVLGKDYFTLKGEFATAQAVTPGQGQTINIAGVPVGEITEVELVDGRALVTMQVEERYAEIYSNATMLLRPKTGLKDMTVQLDPGSPEGGRRVESGFTVPVSRTASDVNLDELLAVLDRDTRDYLRLLLNGAATGLSGRGDELGQLLRRFEPTARYAARITRELETRRRHIRRAVHNFGIFVEALGARDGQIGEFIDASADVFRRFAAQDAALQETLALLPGVLDQTQDTLEHVNDFALELGPALEALEPAAENLGPALVATRPFLRETTPIVRDQLRPFTREVLPVVKTLRPTARQLADATPRFTTSFSILNELLNTLAYNPPGTPESYLFYLAWFNHIGNSVLSTQDAMGAIRRGLVGINCYSLPALRSVKTLQKQSQIGLALLAQLANIPEATTDDPGPYCPQSDLVG